MTVVYRVVSEYKPDDEKDSLPWFAYAVSTADGYEEVRGWGSTREEAIAQVQSKLRMKAVAGEREEFYADKNGEPLEQPSGHMMGDT